MQQPHHHARSPDAVGGSIKMIAASLLALAPALLDLKSELAAHIQGSDEKIDVVTFKFDSLADVAMAKDAVPVPERLCAHQVYADFDTAILENVLEDLSSRYAVKTTDLISSSLESRLYPAQTDLPRGFEAKRQAYLRAAGVEETRVLLPNRPAFCEAVKPEPVKTGVGDHCETSELANGKVGALAEVLHKVHSTLDSVVGAGCKSENDTSKALGGLDDLPKSVLMCGPVGDAENMDDNSYNTNSLLGSAGALCGADILDGDAVNLANVNVTVLQMGSDVAEVVALDDLPEINLLCGPAVGDSLSAASLGAAAPMARGKGSSSIPRADSRGPAEGIASWIAGRTKKQILDLVEVACPCLHTAWAAHALSMGHSAALKGKKCEVQRLRSFLSGALDQQIVFDADGRRCIGIGLKKSCMCSSTTCSLAPCSLTPTTWTPPAPT